MAAFEFSEIWCGKRVLTRWNSYLWPGYSEQASNYHVLILALICNVKRREHLETWSKFGRAWSPSELYPTRGLQYNIEIFEERPDDFSSLFRRILSMTLDRTLSTTLRTHLLCFLIHAFQSLDCTIVRKECAPLVSIGIWHNLSTEKRQEAQLDSSPHLRKAWRAAQKRYDAADEATKARLRFERSWLYTLILDFINQLYNESSKSGMSTGW